MLTELFSNIDLFSFITAKELDFGLPIKIFDQSIKVNGKCSVRASIYPNGMEEIEIQDCSPKYGSFIVINSVKNEEKNNFLNYAVSTEELLHKNLEIEEAIFKSLS